MSTVIEKRAIDLLWRQWTVLGVAGVAPVPQQAVDLEGLIAFTPFVAAVDPRLAAESADWCARIGPRFISISRLRQILKLMPPCSHQPEFDLPRMVFRGTKSTERRVSGKSRPPALDHPSLLQLRSRFIFGVGARADVLARLAMKGRVEGGQRISEMASTGYTKVAIATILDELAYAGILKKYVRSTGGQYELSRGGPLRALLSPFPNRMPPWAERFAVVARILEAWRRFGKRPTYVVELAKVLDDLKDLAARAGTSPPRTKPSRLVHTADRWASALLEDEVWESSWIVNGEDLASKLLSSLHDGIVEAVHQGDYPVGYTELSDFEFKVVDRKTGKAEYVVQFSAEHPREDFSFRGHVDGTFGFDPHASKPSTLLRSIELQTARAHFDMGD